MKRNNTLIGVRLLWSLLGLTGLVLQAISTNMNQPGYFSHPTLAINFFSYFTILTNVFISLWFILTFCSTLQGGKRWWNDRPEVKGALLVAGTVTVLVYWTLLSNIPIPNAIGRIANFLVHLLVPLGLWIDWLLVGEPVTRAYRKMLGFWLIFPIVYVIYSEIRGPFVHWYPYFFLNPAIVGGVGNLLLWIIGMILLFLLIASLIFWLYQKRGKLKMVPASTTANQDEQV